MSDDEEFNWVSIPEFDDISPQKEQYDTDGGTRIISHTGEAINIMDITVDRNANGIMSPVETGSYVFDNKVIMPLSVSVSITIEERWWQSVWERLLKMYNNRKYEFYSVCTRGELIENLMLLNMPRRETSDKFDAVDVNLKFVQVVYATERSYRAENAQNNRTVATGQKSLTAFNKIRNTYNYGMTLR